MAISTYDESLRLVLKYEGGYTNHPADPGGPTNWGITINDARMYWKKNATAQDVKVMPLSVAKTIYKARYWDVLRCDELPPGLDYTIMDYGVNSGVGRSGKVLRRALGLPDNTSVVTDQVIAAVRKANITKLINFICSERMAFLRSLRTWPSFGKGWTARVTAVRAHSLNMAGKPTVLTPEPIIPPKTEKAIIPINTKGQVGSSVGTATVGTTAAAQPGLPAWAVIAIILVTVAIVVGAVLFFKWKQKRDQEAPVKFTMEEGWDTP